jgi:hypothetical protein
MRINSQVLKYEQHTLYFAAEKCPLELLLTKIHITYMHKMGLLKNTCFEFNRYGHVLCFGTYIYAIVLLMWHSCPIPSMSLALSNPICHIDHVLSNITCPVDLVYDPIVLLILSYPVSPVDLA